jgi:hypothetical protein
VGRGRREPLSLHGISVIVLGALLGACAGNGDGLDENGRPIGETPPPGDDPFTTIQQTIFTPICTTCHAGAQAPVGLRLEDGVSYTMLVDVPSAQVPGLRRVAPGDPDNSYLVHKVEGTAAVGRRMPLGLSPLDQEQIDLIRQWIAAGAEPPPAPLAAPAILVASAPAPDEVIIDSAPDMLLVFSRPLDANLLVDTAIVLTAAGGDGTFDDGNEVLQKVSWRPAASGPSVWIRSRSPLPADDYELRLRGTGPLVVASVDGAPIDGDGDGQPGGDAVVRFRVVEAER